MLRHGNQVRLTSSERDLLSTAAGRPVNPTTVDELNAVAGRSHEILLAQADATDPEIDADGVDHSGQAELKLLAALADGLRTEEAPGAAGDPAAQANSSGPRQTRRPRP